MIGLNDRTAAMAACFAAGTMVFGAKATPIVLAIWAIVVVLFSTPRAYALSDRIGGFLKPSQTGSALLIFAIYAGVSSFWASDPRATVEAATLLALMLVLGHALRFGFERLSSAGAVLVAGWFVIGMVCGSILLLAELLSNFAIMRWVLTTFPDIRPSKHFMLQVVEGGRVDVVDRSIGNWNVAGLNLLVWPTLLILSSLVKRRWRFAAGLALLVVCMTITYLSEHQTSQLAIAASITVFALSWYASGVMRRVAMLSFVALVLGVVPLSQIAFQRLELQNAEWAQFTLKERFKIWGYSAAHVPKAPILGIGANNTTIEQTQGLPSADSASAHPQTHHHPHNMILQIWLELGAVGAGLIIIAGLMILRDISRMNPDAAPFGYATAAMVFIQSVATWDLWHVWVQAAFVMAFCMLFLGNRIVAVTTKSGSVIFAEIWLPDRLKFGRLCAAAQQKLKL